MLAWLASVLPAAVLLTAVGACCAVGTVPVLVRGPASRSRLRQLLLTSTVAYAAAILGWVALSVALVPASDPDRAGVVLAVAQLVGSAAGLVPLLGPLIRLATQLATAVALAVAATSAGAGLLPALLVSAAGWALFALVDRAVVPVLVTRQPAAVLS